MKILFLGGTDFVGRHIAEAAIAAGHDVSFFHRGVTNPSLFPDREHHYGDRDGDVSVLERVDADIVIDTSGHTPDAVRASAHALAERVRMYYFMSSVNVYDFASDVLLDEMAPTAVLLEGQTTSERLPELYGAHKMRCEHDLVELLGAERVLAVRAGLMIGPHDNTDRFTYWPTRLERGGEVLVPLGPQLPVQMIDVRDVADWSIRAIAHDLHGPWNLVGTPGTLTLGDVMHACEQVTNVKPTRVCVPSEFLVSQGVAPWVELPLWAPDLGELARFCSVRNDRARAFGLALRPLAETVRDILSEYRARPQNRPMRAGLASERESFLLRAWHAHSSIASLIDE